SSAAISATQNVNETARKEKPGRARVSGRPMNIRSENNPTAAITVRNVSQRAISSLGVAAVSLIDGITNCGCGPGFGPTANVKAPRTGWPSTEITRQKTKYQPGGSVFSGVTRMSGFVGERCGEPAVTCRASASVTETIA